MSFTTSAQFKRRFDLILSTLPKSLLMKFTKPNNHERNFLLLMKIFWLNKHLKEEVKKADPFIMQLQTKRKKIMKPKKVSFNQSAKKSIKT